MKVKMILPALTEATSPFWRPIKYSLFPPLGLATLAGYLNADDEIEIQDEHVERLRLDDEPDLVVLQVYITSAYRAYALADHYRRKGAHVALGGLHVTSLPNEAAQHADTIFLGPGEDTWPQFLADFRAGHPGQRYESKVRTLIDLPPVRRDLIKRRWYLVPNSIVVSRGCPHACDFCYKEAFFAGGKSFYTQTVDAALAEIERLPGRHLYFLDDHLFGHPQFAAALFAGMHGMHRLWQAAATVKSILMPGLLEKAVQSGLRSLFVGFETATFHILTPYPGTALHRRLSAEGRVTSSHWDLYDTRHVIFQPARLSPESLETGYWRAYREFYRWGSIFTSASAHARPIDQLRHLAYAGGWKKFEPLWDAVIRAKRVPQMLPLLENLLAGFGAQGTSRSGTARRATVREA